MTPLTIGGIVVGGVIDTADHKNTSKIMFIRIIFKKKLSHSPCLKSEEASNLSLKLLFLPKFSPSVTVENKLCTVVKGSLCWEPVGKLCIVFKGNPCWIGINFVLLIRKTCLNC
jgi:hypothetical protein